MAKKITTAAMIIIVAILIGLFILKPVIIWVLISGAIVTTGVFSLMCYFNKE